MRLADPVEAGPMEAIYLGSAPGPLKLHVDGGSLGISVRAASGVYEMTAVELKAFCDDLAVERSGREPGITGLAIASRIDSGAGGDRWVRMSDTMTRWIKGKEPIHTIDAWIG